MPKATENQFEAIALPHMDAVYRAALAICGQEHLAEDLAQATFLKAMKGFASFRVGTDCKAWLMRILRNTWTDWLRRRRVEGPLLSLDAVADRAADQAQADSARPSGSGGRMESLSDREVIRAMQRLTEDQRLTLFLVDVEDFSYEEAADIMGVPAGTAKSRANRARAALKDLLEEHAGRMGYPGRKP